MRDIENKADIKIFVNLFYQRVKENEILAPVFNSRISEDEWPVHLQRLYTFWNAILFSEAGFNGNPMEKHMTLPIGEVHFSTWLQLFNQTIDELYGGAKASEAKQRAASIAGLMRFKIDSLRRT